MDQSIIIIGAGISGFSAAQKLLEEDFKNIIILEAEDRIGGRINSVNFSDGIVDLGAQWVHGQGNNMIYEMFNKHFDFGSTPFDECEATFLFSNGTKSTETTYQKLYEIAYSIIMNIDDYEDPEDSIGELFLRIFDDTIKSEKHGLQNTDKAVVDSMKEIIQKYVNGYYASKSWFDLSAKLNAEESSTGGNQYNTWKKQGFKTVFDFISKKLPNPSEYIDIESKVQFNKKVNNIKYNQLDESSDVLVSCSGGTKFTAKHVIFTPSLGVLKKHHQNLFTPNLPTDKALAIETYGFGTVGKLFLEFDKSFWTEADDEFVTLEFLWLDDAKNEVINTNREWLLDITGVFGVDKFPNMLEFFFGGSHLHEFEAASDETIIDDCMWLLQKFHGRTLPKPKAMTRTKWLTNDNFLGSYSYASIEAEKAAVGTLEIAYSIKSKEGTPLILFAGEATDDKFPSTTHGAMRSGHKTAKEIMKFYNQ